MYCPNCGLQENQETQYCRACGADLNVVRDAVTGSLQPRDSGQDTRNDIGRAFAAKIETLKSARELKKVTKEVLPEIEKFLESSSEKRLRRVRTGSLISMIGLGTAIGFMIAGIFGEDELLKLAALGFVTFFIGIAFLINGFLFTVPQLSGKEDPEKPDLPESLSGGIRSTNELLMPPSARSEFSSVTENTTRTLDDKLPVREERKSE